MGLGLKPLDNTKFEYFIDTTDLIQFIKNNSDMGWNKVCDYIADFLNDEEYITHYSLDGIKSGDFDYLSREKKQWLIDFVEVNGIDRDFYFVFTN